MIKVSSLKTHKRNPRKISSESFEGLCKSIKDDPEFMALRPIIVDENNYVIGGNQRLKAINQLGLDEIPDEWVKKAELSDEKKKRFLVVDNSPKGMSGEWDEQTLLDDFSIDDLVNLGLENEINLDLEIGQELIEEKTENLKPLKWTRILVSIPVGVSIQNIDAVFSEIEKNGGLVDYGCN